MASQPSFQVNNPSGLSSSQTVTNSRETDDEPPALTTTESKKGPPEGGYGWVCVVAVFLINAHTWGVNSAYGVILAFYLSDHTFKGATALDYAFVGGLSIACAMLTSPLATYLTQRVGIRFVLSVGAVIEAASFIATSFVKDSWQLFLSEGICFGVGMGLCFIGSVGVISHWFTKRRSLVNGIAAAGSGIGGLIYSLATGAMIPSLGLPWTMRVVGILCFVMNLICGNLLRIPNTSSSRPQSAALRFRMLQNPEFLLLLGWVIFSSIAYVGLLFSLSSYAVAVGRTSHQASIVSAILNLGQAFGRPGVGFISDSLGRIDVSFVATVLSGVFCLAIWPFAKSMAALSVYSILVGLVAGTLWAAAPPLAAEIVGISGIANALGICWLALAPPTVVAEVIAVQLRDDPKDTRPYLRVQLFVGFMYIGAACFLAGLKILRSRKLKG